MMLIYCRSCKRRPIRLGYAYAFQDPQAQIPVSWCERCGSEVFSPGQTQCPRCRGGKGEKI